MKHKAVMAAAAALSLTLLAGCMPPALPSDGVGSSTSSTSDREAAPSDVVLYDCGGLVVAIPSRYQDILEVRQNDGAYGASTLLSVYEKDSLKEAEADGVEHADEMGWLFSVVRCGPDQYREAMEAQIPGLDLFARDDEWYYGWATPTDVRLYRRGKITEKDSRQWEQVLQVSDIVKEDFRRRNELLPTLGNSTQTQSALPPLKDVMKHISPGDITSVALLGNADPQKLTDALHTAADHPVQRPLDAPCWKLDLLLEGGPEMWTAEDLRMELSCGLEEGLVQAAILRGDKQESAVFESTELYQMVRHSFDTKPVIDQQAARTFRYILEPKMKKVLDTLQKTADCYTGYELTRLTPVFSFVEDASGAVWAGGMHLDGDLRVHGVNAAGPLAVRTVNKELTDTAFMGSSFQFVPDLPEEDLKVIMHTIQQRLDSAD